MCLEDFHAAQSTAKEVFEVLHLFRVSTMWIGVPSRYPLCFIDYQMWTNMFRIWMSVRQRFHS